METKRMMAAWGGPERDVLAILPGYPTPDFSGVPLNESGELVAYELLDGAEEPTGEIVGVEIVGFLEFDEWDEIPDLPVRWSINDGPAESPKEALRILQGQLRARARLAHAS